MWYHHEIRRTEIGLFMCPFGSFVLNNAMYSYIDLYIFVPLIYELVSDLGVFRVYLVEKVSHGWFGKIFFLISQFISALLASSIMNLPLHALGSMI
jgi:hypothetical protein